jgi:hypothetical protein
MMKMLAVGLLIVCVACSGNASTDYGRSQTDDQWKNADGVMVPPCNAETGITHWEQIANSPDDMGLVYDMMHGLGYKNLQGHYLQTGQQFLSGDCNA